jgi:xylan 1,4-beta-xylosidase
MSIFNKHILIILIFSNSVFSQQKREIHLDYNKTSLTQNTEMYLNCIGAGRANEGLRADWQEQLKTIQQEIHFKYIRFHGIFHEDMGVYKIDKNGNEIYNWQYVDKLYDFILSIGLKPFVELSFMPKGLASGDKTVFWWKANITKPKNWVAYGKLISEFTKHLAQRYGKEEVKSWYFEVWNEPNHHAFFNGTIDDYFTMYSTALKAIKEVSNDFKVGGPSTAGAGWIDEFLDYTIKSNLKVDFISTHAYNVKGVLDEFGKKKLFLLPDSLAVVKSINEANDKLKNKNKKEVEFHVTEWSSSYSATDAVHDTYQNATFVLNTLKKINKEVNSMSYWVFTDIFEEPGIPTKPFHGGFGLLNLQGIKKPTYFAYKYLNQLGNVQLENSDMYSWASKDSKGVQLLLYDFSYPKIGKTPNQEFFIQDLPSTKSSEVSITIDNLKNGKYTLEVYKTGYKNNDAFTYYHEMGRPNELTRNQENILKMKTTDLPIISKIITIESNNFFSTFSLNSNDILFIKLIKS